MGKIIRNSIEKEVFICENHNEVLPFWSKFKKYKPYLISFDHHTDLHCAFQGKINGIGSKYKPETQDEFLKIQQELLLQLEENNFSNISELKNDEHIDAAIKLEFFEKALIYSFDSYWNRKDRVWTIDFEEDYQNQKIIVNSICVKENDNLIETSKLEPCFNIFDEYIDKDLWQNNYILDIDLDFFKTKKSIAPQDGSFFKSLIDNALGISIAKESRFVDYVKQDEDLSADYLLEKLLKFIN